MRNNEIEVRLQQLQNKFKNSKVKKEYYGGQAIRSDNQQQKHHNQSLEKQKIIEENIKLKEQIFQLSHQLQQILQKDKNRKRKYGSIHPSDDEQTLRQKKSELRKQQLETLQLKNKIYAIKRQLENVYNKRNMMIKQQQLRSLKSELKQLQQEKEGLNKIKNEHLKYIRQASGEINYQQKIEDLKKQLSKVKEQVKTTNDKVLDAQKILRKNHEQYIIKQQKLRDLQQKLTAAKQKLKSKRSVLNNVTPQMIKSLEQQISVLEQQRKENEKLWQQKIKSIDIEYEQKKLQQQKKILICKQKQKQFRINEIKIKQLRKLVRHNTNEVSGKKGNNEMDMNKFRHKRNIKYLDK